MTSLIYLTTDVIDDRAARVTSSPLTIDWSHSTSSYRQRDRQTDRQTIDVIALTRKPG